MATRVAGKKKLRASGKAGTVSNDIDVLRCNRVTCSQLRFTNVNGSVIVNNGPPGKNEPINQGTDCINIGSNAGRFNQSSSSIAIGVQAGEVSLGFQSIAIGPTAGRYNSAINSVNIGHQAGFSNSTSNQQTVAIGNQAGYLNQNPYSVALGYQTGYSNIGTYSVAIGRESGYSNLNQLSISIGTSNNYYPNALGFGTIAIGTETGFSNQGPFSTAIGKFAATTNQGSLSTAIGPSSQQFNSQNESIAIGNYAGNQNQGFRSTAIGYKAGMTNQNSQSVAIGFTAGSSNQGIQSTTIGSNSGFVNQGLLSTIIGNNSGVTNVPVSVAIIGNNVNPSTFVFRLYLGLIKDISVDNSGTAGILQWNSSTYEVTNNIGKSFIIPHPEFNEKYLVHACLEGPESGVYYRGKFDINEGYRKFAIKLPSYASKIAHTFQVFTSIETSEKEDNNVLASDVINGEYFYVVSKYPCKINYIVYATREEIISEIRKEDVILKGSGPYKYIERCII